MIDQNKQRYKRARGFLKLLGIEMPLFFIKKTTAYFNFHF